ncbi:MAG: Gfo/Idh/MocA family oxidoreductase [Microthrixaceae bacterium]|nr:Gfo/Idh/MocA family oxidoreductase [Microthrixaceae bacterium]
MTALRMGVIGLGMMGRHHIRILGGLDEVELVGLHDPLGDPHGVAGGLPVASTLDEFVELGIDAAVVATPTDDHLKVGLRLAEAGIHALIEKPLAADVEAGEKLLDAFNAAGLVGAVGHVERFNPAIRALKARLAAGELGDLYQVATSRQGPFPDRVRDVGVIKDLATHDIDLTQFVAGAAFESVSARVAHRAGRPHEDLVAAVGRLTDGTVTNHLVNWLTPTKERRVTVTGEKGCFVADTLTADLTFYANASVATEWDDISRFRGVSEGDVVRYAIAKPEPLLVEHTGFRDAVLGRGGEIVSAADGLAVLRVAAAMSRAAREGTVEEVG